MQPVTTVDPYGTLWRLDGKLHREAGPAAEYTDGTRMWYINGKVHREDGPAVEYANGEHDWYFNGDCLTFNEWLSQVAATEERRIALIMRWG